MTEKDLLELKEKIKEANEKFLQFKGQREALLQQLNEDWEMYYNKTGSNQD